MSSVTEDDAHNDLADLLTGITGVELVAHEPAEARNGMATIRRLGGNPTDYRFQVTIYVRGGDVSDNQSRLWGLRQAVDDATKLTSQFVPGDYTYTEIDGTDAWFCAMELTAGREDF